MDFGKILDQWESGKHGKSVPAKGRRRKTSPDSAGPKGFEAMLEASGFVDKDYYLDKERPAVPGEGRQKLKRMPHERTLDLHGCSVTEGLTELEGFINRAKADKLKKVLIIHGKGKHSPEGPVLRDAVRKYLSESSVIGETGKPKRNDGGDGATWAVIRYRSR